MEEFVEVDVSLESSNKIEDGNLKSIYGKINAVLQKDNPKRLLADSIFKLTNDAVDFIDSLKTVLNKKDVTGDSTSVATSLLVNTETSKHLYRKLTDLQSVTGPARNDAIQNSYTDDLSGDLISPMNKSWDTTCFHEVPTVAAVTMLKKFQNDCYKAGFEVLRNIYRNSIK